MDSLSPEELRKEVIRQRRNARRNEQNAANREAQNVRRRERWAANREARNARQREGRAANREARNARQNLLNAGNREVVNTRQNERRAIRRIDLERQKEDLRSRSKLNDDTFILTEEELKFALDCVKKNKQDNNGFDKSDLFFSDVECSPLKSALLFYINSGCINWCVIK